MNLRYIYCEKRQGKSEDVRRHKEKTRRKTNFNNMGYYGVLVTIQASVGVAAANKSEFTKYSV